ncbi:MAG: hypothetical protein HOP11_14750 [Saprospiraceae bacterium]|nr:hypothetical protein [Saprospiraceae bacterium]
MNQLIRILWLVLFVLFCSGYFLQYSIQKSFHRQKVRTLITSQTSHIAVKYFTLDNEFQKQIRWFEKDEFKFNGRMYDVISIELDSCNNNILICYEDKDEDLLDRHFAQVISNNNNLNCYAQFTSALHFSLEQTFFNIPLSALIYKGITSKRTHSLMFFQFYSKGYGKLVFSPPDQIG